MCLKNVIHCVRMAIRMIIQFRFSMVASRFCPIAKIGLVNNYIFGLGEQDSSKVSSRNFLLLKINSGIIDLEENEHFI